MSSATQSFAFLIGLARDLLARVRDHGQLSGRPLDVSPAAVRRLATGVRMLASFVRRLLVLMALGIEHGLVDRLQQAAPLARPHGRKHAAHVRFTVLEARAVFFNSATAVDDGFSWLDRKTLAHAAPKPPSTARLYALLDLLAMIVADPEPRARRLAFHLARRRDGPILPPAGPARVAGHWGTGLTTSHDAMGAAIITASRARPPPLPPPRRAGPVVTQL